MNKTIENLQDRIEELNDVITSEKKHFNAEVEGLKDRLNNASTRTERSIVSDVENYLEHLRRSLMQLTIHENGMHLHKYMLKKLENGEYM